MDPQGMIRRWTLLLLTGFIVGRAAVGLVQQTSPAADALRPGAPVELPFTVPPGFVVERIAGPPLVEHPMFACFDDRGRLYVADSRGINPKGAQLDRQPVHVIRRLESSRGDGRFDQGTIFADQLTYPEGVLWHDGAVFTAAPPSVWRLEDTKGTGKADQRRELVTGYVHTGIADDLHGPSLGPDGRIYWGCGRFPHKIRQPGGPVLWEGKAPLIQRCRPDGTALEVMCGAQGNPVKLAFSSEGEPFACGTWARGDRDNHNQRFPGRQDVIIHCVEGGNYPMLDGDFYAPEFKHTPDLLAPLVYLDVAAACGLTRYEGNALGAEYHGNLFSALFNMHQVRRHILERDGATFRSRTEDFVVSNRSDFHPTDVLEDADGSLVVVDSGSWFEHCPTSKLGKGPVPGGIYRIRRVGAAVVEDPRGLALPWVGLSAEELARRLGDGRFAVRARAVQQLSRRGTDALAVLREALKNQASALVRREAVWVLTRLEGVEALRALRVALADKDTSVRLTAVTAVGLLRDTGAMSVLTQLVKTDSPPIRREAATALGRLKDTAAVGALFESLRAGGDPFLEHATIYALIQIGDRGATLKGLADPSPAVKRGALVALDQMDGGNLTRELVTPLLSTDDPALQKTALAVITTRGWSKEIVSLLRQWLAQEVPADSRESLRGTVLALCKDPAIQELVARALVKDETPVTTRLLLLETIARAPLDKFPESWSASLGRALDHPDESVVRQAVATLRAGRVDQFDDRLVRLAKDLKKPAELRLAALAAVANRLPRVEPVLFDFLLAHLDKEVPSLERLAAAGALGDARLDDGQLERLTGTVVGVGALEMPHLITAFERSKSPAVGEKLIAALARAPGLESLSPEVLRRTLQGYPEKVHVAARPLFKRLEVDTEKMKARLAELVPLLTGGDARRGREVFLGNKANCTACHTVQGQGGQVGPDLSKIGAVRGGRDLLEAIVFPSASFARGYEPYLVTTRAGRTFSGILRQQTAEAIYLVTSDRSELRVQRQEVETLEPGKVSIMPQGLDAQLSQQELVDLIAFLQALR